MEIISTLLTGIRFFTGDLGRRRRAAWNKLKAKARTSLAGRVLRQGNARMKTKQYSTTDENKGKCISLKLTTKTIVRVILWLSIATDHALAKSPLPSEQTASTNLNRWESIDYPGIRLSPESGRSNAWVSVRIVNSSIGPFMGVTSSGESTPFSTRDGSLAVRLHRPSGETVIPEEPLHGPVGISDGSGRTGYNNFGLLFRGVSNALEEAWIELKIAKQRFWLEVPYGFTQTASNISTRPVFNGPPKFAPAMKDRAPEDLLLAWREARYDLGTIQNGWHLSLIALNTFEPETEIALYRDDVRAGESIFLWELRGRPQTALSIRDRDGMIFKARCMGVRITDDGMRRIDTFKCFTRSEPDQRCWGTLTVEIDDKSYSVVVPSSLYKFGHNAAEPYDNMRIHEWR